MAPPTRLDPFRTPSPEPLNGKEASTRRKTKFIDAFAHNPEGKSLATISRDCKIGPSTGRKWRDEYITFGEMAKKPMRSESAILGRKSKVTKLICKKLCSPSQNPVRMQQYEAQIVYHNLPIGKRQLQRKMKEHTKKGGRYKCGFVKKVISAKNRGERGTYGLEHVYHSLFGFFDHIVYTDEAHVDPTSTAPPLTTPEQGTRDKPENIVERLPLQGVRFHIAAWISWWGKSDKLEFYNDEEDKVEHPPYPTKPRRRPTTETEEEYQARVLEWEAGKPHAVEAKVQGNAMTQKYYVERLLPIYCDAVEKMRLIDDKTWL
ncbi:MAG: hypothetical protein Q9210_002165 [Variospora velana]